MLSDKIDIVTNSTLQQIGNSAVTDAENGFSSVIKLSVNKYQVGALIIDELEGISLRSKEIKNDASQLEAFVDTSNKSQGVESSVKVQQQLRDSVESIIRKIALVRNQEHHTVESIVNSAYEIKKECMEAQNIVYDSSFLGEEEKQSFVNEFQKIFINFDTLEDRAKELGVVIIKGYQNAGYVKHNIWLFNSFQKKHSH